MSKPTVPVDENQASLPEAPKQPPTRSSSGSSEPIEDTVNESASDGEVNDSEEALFADLEHEEEEEAARQALQQPKDISVAPTLLRKALADGQVKADESEEESDKEMSKPVSPEPHLHARVSHREH